MLITDTDYIIDFYYIKHRNNIMLLPVITLTLAATYCYFFEM